MTDEEKAEKYADWFWGASPSERRAIKQAYLDGVAEVRKENEDLKKQKQQTNLFLLRETKKMGVSDMIIKEVKTDEKEGNEWEKFHLS